ncbi:MAG: hypothetical protein U0835_06480 [Isosphaeraceae bacterium]
MTTALQAEANRRNGGLSKGPVSNSGKAVSRSNALTHGLSGAGVVLPPDEAEEVARREAECIQVFRPVNVAELFHARQYALESVRVERCQKIERALRKNLARRGSDPDAWDEDRRFDAEETAARLGRDPARTVRRLRQTLQGCEWLIERWEGLERAVAPGRGPWDDAQRTLALDLLGLPEPLRNAPTPADPGEASDAGATQRTLASAHLADLRRLRDRVLLVRDDDDRYDAVCGVETGEGALQKALKLIRRYESECRRRLDRSLHLLLSGRLMPGVADARGPQPPLVAPTSPEPPPPLPPAPPEPEAKRPEPEIEPSEKDLRPRGNRRWRKEQKRRQSREVEACPSARANSSP